MGRRVLRNVYPESEFIRSTEANFRPVNSATAPDGTMYLVDMHQGIIQESAWVPEGSFISKAIKWYGLDKNIHNGRIYRVRHKDFEPGAKPNMLNESPAQWVEHLSHPNGWWRDEAQKLIVLSGDQSVIPALKEKVSSGDFGLGRLHALWTLEGLGAIEFEFLKTAFTNKDAKVRAAAVRMSEPFFQKDTSFLAELAPLTKDSDNDVLIQLLLSMSTRVTPETRKLAESVLANNTANQYLAEIDQELNKAWFEAEAEKVAMSALSEQKRDLMMAGKTHYTALCLSCHGADGKGMPNPAIDGTTMAPSFVGSPRVLGAKGTLARIALDGMSGPLDGKEYPGGIMIPLKANDDHYIASVLTYLRNSFENEAEMITPEEVAAVRKDTLGRSAPYTQHELNEIMLNADCPTQLWNMTTSHRTEDAGLLADGDEKTSWTSHHEMKGEMWVEVEFPHPRNLDRILMDAQHGTDFPEKLRIEFSADGEEWSKSIEADGAKLLELKFEKTVARKVRISLAQDKQKWWAIGKLEISGPTGSDIEKYDPSRRVYLKLDDAASAKQSWSAPKQDKSVLGQGLTIAEEPFEHGIGTHSASEIVYHLSGKGYARFFAKCGPQGKRGKTVMTFEVHLDGEKVFDTGDMQAGDEAEFIDVNVTGRKELKLIVTPGSDGKTEQDHANWVDAIFVNPQAEQKAALMHELLLQAEQR
jgi:mono/diheme cytochrome c family protein